jgi:hypothetical protein
MTQEEKLLKLHEALKQVAAEQTFKPISAEYATAMYMTFAAILMKWFEVSEEDLAAFVRYSKDLNMTCKDAKSQIN